MLDDANPETWQTYAREFPGEGVFVFAFSE
jgi:hypothetical protein